MLENLEDHFFHLLIRTLNYSMEFLEPANFITTPSPFASYRFRDLLGHLLDIQPLMTGMQHEEFYEELREFLKARRGEGEWRSKDHKELMQRFHEEWQRRMRARAAQEILRPTSKGEPETG